MSLTLSSVFVFALICASVTASSVHKRQAGSIYIDQYIEQVRTALYAIDVIQSGNSSTACADPTLPDDLENGGYDGDLAQQIICESAFGFDIFPDINHAAVEMQSALDALSDARNQTNQPAVQSACLTLDVDSFDNAGLNGTAIQDAICQAASSIPVATNTIITTPTATPVELSSASFGKDTTSPTMATGSLANSPVNLTAAAVSATIVSQVSSDGSTNNRSTTNSFSISFTHPGVASGPDPSIIVVSDNSSFPGPTGTSTRSAVVVSSTEKGFNVTSTSASTSPIFVIATAPSSRPVNTSSATSTIEAIFITTTLTVYSFPTGGENGPRPHQPWPPYPYSWHRHHNSIMPESLSNTFVSSSKETESCTEEGV